MFNRPSHDPSRGGRASDHAGDPLCGHGDIRAIHDAVPLLHSAGHTQSGRKRAPGNKPAHGGNTCGAARGIVQGGNGGGRCARRQ